LVERLGDNSFETVLNQRLAHCKVCGDEIPKEEGVSWIFYATYTSHSDKLPPSFMDQFPYLCRSCDSKVVEEYEEFEVSI